MPIELSDRQSLAWKYLQDSITTELFYGGAAGGGKSYLGCIWQIYRRTTYPKTRGLIGRAKISNLEQSTLVTYFKVAAAMGYRQGGDFHYNSQKHIITWRNGSQNLLKDLFLYPADPDFISLGSTEYTDAFIDEMPEVTLKAMEIVSTRLRWMLDDYKLTPKLLGTGNPSEGFVKERFIIRDNQRVELKPHQKFVQSLLTDNPDPEFVKLYLQQLENLTSDYDRQRLIYGDWEAAREVARPFMHQYDPKKHESIESVFKPEKPLLIGVDFNLNPFAVSFSHLWKDVKGEHFHTFDEMSIKRGSIPDMIDRIKARYENKLASCKVTGDASGSKGEISQRDNASNYIQLMRGLRLNPKQMEVPRSNPLHENSQADCNYILRHFPDYKINPVNCPILCRDMRTVQSDAFGKIIKKNRLDESQQADMLDGERYKINTWLKQWINWHQKIKK